MVLFPELEELQEELGQELKEHCEYMCDMLGSMGFIHLEHGNCFSLPNRMQISYVDNLKLNPHKEENLGETIVPV